MFGKVGRAILYANGGAGVVCFGQTSLVGFTVTILICKPFESTQWRSLICRLFESTFENTFESTFESTQWGKMKPVWLVLLCGTPDMQTGSEIT